MKKIRALVWNEFKHEQEHEEVRRVYPDGIHVALADGLNEADDIVAKTATLPEPEHGLTQAVLDETDVLYWWGHMAHHMVQDEIVERVHRRVLQGMGLVVLHSGHVSKIFRKLMGTTCYLRWREAGERERVWVCNPGHPITMGLGECIEIPETEMYGEPFDVPPPDEQLFISWYEGGEVFRSGATWVRGNGKVFYFSPGHETHPIYFQNEVKLVLKNAARWAYRPGVWNYDTCPHIPMEATKEKIQKAQE